MQAEEWLKTFLASQPSQSDACLACLTILEQPAATNEVRLALRNFGVRKAKDWNVSRALASIPSLAIKTDGGWETLPAGREFLAERGMPFSVANVERVGSSLRAHISTELDADAVRYLHEVIQAFELKMYRSAVVMSWVAAIHMIKTYVCDNELRRFNDEAYRRDNRWRIASNYDGISRAKERDILEICHVLGLYSKEVKLNLISCLDRRNACGHPNDFALAENTVAHHVEILILNVFNRRRFEEST